ncbi:hypothetical protein [Staphylococcus hyicus]|uniref:hypothetical protein n=1 Tax=Staphylococcus hyicus TaxID=1284 RepID=UPI003132AC9D
MAAKSNKNLVDIKSKVENVLEKVNVESIDYGNVYMDDESKEFILDHEDDMNNLISYLEKFIDNLQEQMEKSKQEQIQNKIFEQLKNGGENAELVAKLFKN